LNEGEGGPFEYPEPAQVYPNPLTHDSEPWVLKRYLEGEITIGSLNLPGSISDSTIVEVDAWGILTLTTQSKSYQCLRLKKHEFRTIGIDPFPIFLPGGYSRVIETYTYSWITTHFDVVLELTSSANNGEYFSKADIAVLATNITPNVNGIDCDPCRTDNMPEQFFLEQNFPNPFNPTTQFQYTLLEPAEVQIFIFNVLGQPISVMDEGFKGIGTYRVTWNAKNPNSTPLTSGIYFYKLHAKAMDGSIFTQKRKMILTK